MANTNLKSVLNFRDVGGIVSEGEIRIKAGIVFRSANIDRISGSDIKKLRLLNIKTIIDLRAEYERKKNFKTVKNITRLSLPLDFAKATREKLIPHIKNRSSEKIISDISNELYLEIFNASGPIVKNVMEILLSSEGSATVIHCQAGKDRTGIISAIIQMALKADRTSIILEFLKSNDSIIPYFRKILLIRKILSFGFFPAGSVLFAITVKQRNIESVLDRIENHYGGIENYLDSVGFDSHQLERLRSKFLENQLVH
jgi:protein-tyrosine phosphatase